MYSDYNIKIWIFDKEKTLTALDIANKFQLKKKISNNPIATETLKLRRQLRQRPRNETSDDITKKLLYCYWCL